MCESDEKVNLGIGAYRDENGNPYVLNVVRQVSVSVASEISGIFYIVTIWLNAT